MTRRNKSKRKSKRKSSKTLDTCISNKSNNLMQIYPINLTEFNNRRSKFMKNLFMNDE